MVEIANGQSFLVGVGRIQLAEGWQQKDTTPTHFRIINFNNWVVQVFKIKFGDEIVIIVFRRAFGRGTLAVTDFVWIWAAHKGQISQVLVESQPQIG